MSNIDHIIQTHRTGPIFAATAALRLSYVHPVLDGYSTGVTHHASTINSKINTNILKNSATINSVIT